MTPHTTSLEVAEQLTALCLEKGIEMPESYFVYCRYSTVIPPSLDTRDEMYEHQGYDGQNAYTLGELMRILKTHFDEMEYVDGEGWCISRYIDDTGWYKRHFADTPEDAAALLLVELIKSGEITSLHVSA